MTRDEAEAKAFKIAAMLGINVVTKNEDGSQTTRKPKPSESNEVQLKDIVNVILE